MSHTIHTEGRPTATLRALWALLAPVAQAVVAPLSATVDVYAEMDGDDARALRDGAVTIGAQLDPVEGSEMRYFDRFARREVTTVETRGTALVLDAREGFLWAANARGENGLYGAVWSFGSLVAIDHAFVPADYDVRPALRVAAAVLRDAIRRNPSLRREAWRLRRITATLRDMDN